MLKIDGYDDALLGIVDRNDNQPRLLCYDYLKLIDVTRRDSEPQMTYEDAMEFVDFNITSSWMGEGTPYIMYPYTMEEIDEIADNE